MRALVVLALLASCKATGTFQCERDEQCRGGTSGRCETSGYCSFADSSCQSGQRYDEYAGGGLAGVCVGDDPGPDGRDPDGPDGMMATPPCARLALGSDHTCALRGGSVYCWGANNFGERGGGTQTTAVTLPATVSLASSKYTTCAVAMDGTVRCWGYNDSGQLGNGTTGGQSATPVVVTGIANAVQVSVGRSQACARRADGTISCWGDNGEGALGDGSTTSQNTAATTVVGVTAVHVNGTSGAVCAHAANGNATCWGDNRHGQLGDGTTTNRPTPIPAPVTGVSWIGTGSFSVGSINGAQACAIVGGTVRCWGDNAYGQLGNGTTTDSTSPVTAVGITDAVQVAMGRWHVCARTAGKRVLCWGRNLDGEVGDNTQSVRNAPVDVGLSGVLDVSAGGFHTCAITETKELYCWGLNTSQQTGISTGTRHLTPTKSFDLCP